MLLACHSCAALGSPKAARAPELDGVDSRSYAKAFIVFDPDKDATNLRKHGVSLAAAARLDWNAALAWIDDRADYGELRIVALAPIGDRLFFVVFVDRYEGRRIISLRRANRREVNHYVRANEESLHPGSDT